LPIELDWEIETPESWEMPAVASADGVVDPNYPSKGVNSVVIATNQTSVYCFDPAFTPKTAVGSPHLNNNAVVATATPPNAALTTCPSTHRDAAARTYAADTGADAAINFQIVFE